MVHSLKTKLTVYFSVLLLFSLGSITILFNLTMDSLLLIMPTTSVRAKSNRSSSRLRSSICRKAKATTSTHWK